MLCHSVLLSSYSIRLSSTHHPTTSLLPLAYFYIFFFPPIPHPPINPHNSSTPLSTVFLLISSCFLSKVLKPWNPVALSCAACVFESWPWFTPKGVKLRDWDVERRFDCQLNGGIERDQRKGAECRKVGCRTEDWLRQGRLCYRTRVLEVLVDFWSEHS
jgi:hypothetical protein